MRKTHSPAKFARTISDLAEVVGIKPRWLTALRDSRGLPVKKTAKGYPIAPALEWYNLNVRSKKGRQEANEAERRVETPRAPLLVLPGHRLPKEHGQFTDRHSLVLERPGLTSARLITNPMFRV